MFKDYNAKISISYHNREERNAEAAKLIKETIGYGSSLLNIGSGGEEFLKTFLPELKVFDIDITGKADLNVDLEKITKFDFESGSFDLVLALDLLEHIDNFHLILNEMFRCSNKWVLISLPNPGSIFLRMLFNKRRMVGEEFERGVYDKFYGLPLKKPIDRHKWFFTIDDVAEFFEHYSKENRVQSLEFFSSHKWSPIRMLARVVLGKRMYRNLFLPNIWILAKVGED